MSSAAHLLHAVQVKSIATLDLIAPASTLSPKPRATALWRRNPDR